MGGGPPGFRRGFTCPVLLGILRGRRSDFAYGPFTLYGAPFQELRLSSRHPCAESRNPLRHAGGFRLFPVRSPLLRESLLISLPRGTEMFHFPRFASRPYGFRPGCLDMTRGGFPHSDIPGSSACLRLPEAFRSLPRPSSPLGTKASTVRPS